MTSYPQPNDVDYSLQTDMNVTFSESYFDNPLAYNTEAIQPATSDVANQVATRVIQECIYFLPNENNFYHVTWKTISQQDSASSDDHDHDHGFFYQYDFSTIYYVTCKLIPLYLVGNILNKVICGMDFVLDDNVKCNELLTPHQKFNLEQTLKRELHYLMQPQIFEGETKLGYNRNPSSFYGNVELGDYQQHF